MHRKMALYKNYEKTDLADSKLYPSMLNQHHLLLLGLAQKLSVIDIESAPISCGLLVWLLLVV